MDEASPLIEMRDIRKTFPGVCALDGVSLELRRGEVHALVGENGAGKSTLMKILGGVHTPDAGRILLEGRPVAWRGPRHAQEFGIRIVPQELDLFPGLTVAENVFAGHMPARGPFRFEDRRTACRITRDQLARFDLSIDPATPVRRLSLAQQQVVEISKALTRRARVLILDEPTSSLTDHETRLLFDLIRRLRTEGICVIYISHRLEEIFHIGDRVTVLRDGHHVDTRRVPETGVDEVIRLMVGRRLEDLYGAPHGAPGAEVLRVERLSGGDRFRGVSFALRKGEILGLAGLMGAGRSEVGLTLFGARARTGGAVYLDGEAVQIRTPGQAMARGLGYVSENRKDDALFPDLSVARNISVSHLDRYARVGLLSGRRECAGAREFVSRLNIQTPSAEQAAGRLSGGNQQKVILARWLAIKPRVLIVDEPTRGVDVGAKMEIYALLRRLAGEGVGILLISSELPEVLGLSDRVLVMHEGCVTGELSRAGATEEKIMTLASLPCPIGPSGEPLP